jgi:hypothetical protein
VDKSVKVTTPFRVIDALESVVVPCLSDSVDDVVPFETDRVISSNFADTSDDKRLDIENVLLDVPLINHDILSAV